MNNTDLLVRLQLTGCAYSDLTNTFANDLKWGNKKSKTEWKKLILLNAYISIIEDYHTSSTINCVTEDELKSIFDKVSTLTKICFKPYGFTYINTQE